MFWPIVGALFFFFYILPILIELGAMILEFLLTETGKSIIKFVFWCILIFVLLALGYSL